MKSYIFLKDIKLYAYHGVNRQETKVGNTFTINLRVETDIKPAMTTDEVIDTINYADLYQSLSEEMAIPSKLLEHVAGRIVKRIFREYPTINSIDLQLAKQNPPMGADIAVAGVEIHCNRQSITDI